MSTKVIYTRDREGLTDSQLKINIKGNIITPSIVNSIRRSAINKLPMYAFQRNNIIIHHNTSIYNNDMMRDRISHIPIYDIDTGIVNLERQYWHNIDYTSKDIPKHENDSYTITMFLDVTNNTNNVMNVTTNDARYYENNETVHKYDTNYPILLIKLHPTKSFSFTATAKLNIGTSNAIWNSSNACYYEFENENDITLTIESAGQYSEKSIYNKSCEYIIGKLTMYEKAFADKTTDKKQIRIKLQYDDHTIVVPIVHAMQNTNKLKSATYYKESMLDSDMFINVELLDSDNSNPYKYLLNATKELKNIYTKLTIK
jgi:DNA-directed RNA polymerase subunit L